MSKSTNSDQYMKIIDGYLDDTIGKIKKIVTIQEATPLCLI